MNHGEFSQVCTYFHPTFSFSTFAADERRGVAEELLRNELENTGTLRHIYAFIIAMGHASFYSGNYYETTQTLFEIFAFL